MATFAKLLPELSKNSSFYYSSVWELEKSVDMVAWVNWMNPMACAYIVGIYLVLTFGGQAIMKNRGAFCLKESLCLWNTFLAIFSFFGALRTVPAIMQNLGLENGFYTSVCASGHYDTVTAFWSLLFTLSKVVELGDTAFVILKKKPLIFLHWFHHMTVLAYTWITFPAFNSTGPFCMSMNYLIHTIMYTYYVLKLRGVRVPKTASIMVTFLQILQMVIGLTVNIYTLYIKSSGRPCDVQLEHIYACLTMYAAFFVLFANYFRQSYMVPRRKKLD